VGTPVDPVPGAVMDALRAAADWPGYPATHGTPRLREAAAGGVPDQWKDFYKANVEFFEDLGSPGGASKVGKINKDHAIVAALPPQAEEG